tara:strand:+ start:2240 stop:2449 length:210 start_codon:yes stop_codon:yes gene_type:complete
MSESKKQSGLKSKWMPLGIAGLVVVGILVFASPDFGEDTSNMGGTITPHDAADQAPEDCGWSSEFCGDP